MRRQRVSEGSINGGQMTDLWFRICGMPEFGGGADCKRELLNGGEESCDEFTGEDVGRGERMDSG